MMFIVATNVIASRPPDRLERRTLVPIIIINIVARLISFYHIKDDQFRQTQSTYQYIRFVIVVRFTPHARS